MPHSRLPAATAAGFSRGTRPALRLRLFGRAGVEAARVFPVAWRRLLSEWWLGARSDPWGPWVVVLRRLVPAPEMGHHGPAERSALEPTVWPGAPSLVWRRWTWWAVGRVLGQDPARLRDGGQS